MILTVSVDRSYVKLVNDFQWKFGLTINFKLLNFTLFRTFAQMLRLPQRCGFFIDFGKCSGK